MGLVLSSPGYSLRLDVGPSVVKGRWPRPSEVLLGSRKHLFVENGQLGLQVWGRAGLGSGLCAPGSRCFLALGESWILEAAGGGVCNLPCSIKKRTVGGMHKGTCPGQLRLLQQRNWVACKQEEHSPPRFWGWTSETWVPGGLGSGESPLARCRRLPARHVLAGAGRGLGLSVFTSRQSHLHKCRHVRG